MGDAKHPVGTGSLSDQPFLPSVSSLASLRRAIVLPWGAQRIEVGAPFQSKKSTSPDGPFLSQAAFDRAHLAQAQVLYDASPNEGTYEEHTTTANSRSSEHIRTGIGVSIGGSFLGGSVSGAYDKAVLENNDSHKISQSASVRRGHLRLAEEPPLSSEARSILAERGIAAFEDAYGDYYVAGLAVGADSGMCVSFSEHDRSEVETLTITVTVRFLFMSASRTWSETKASAIRDVQMTMLGHDSLAGKSVSLSTRGDAGFQQLRAWAAELGARSQSIGEDVDARMRTLGLQAGARLGVSDLEALYASQLVVGVLLCPLTGLTQVASMLPPTNRL